MQEVTIPLARGCQFDKAGSPEDILKIVQEGYAHRYLHGLGIAATPANKALVIKENLLKDCVLTGLWAEDGTIAQELKIVPPQRQRACDNLRGSGAEPICVRPPATPRRTLSLSMEEPEEPRQPKELVQELERARNAQITSEDSERTRRLKAELAMLKSKFILPFACEGRPTQPGGRAELHPWPIDAPLELWVPAQHRKEAARPLSVTLDEVRLKLQKWVDELAPLELLTSRTESAALRFDDLRGTLRDSDVARLVGLLAHLLSWLCLGSTREPPLKESALQSMLSVVYELWSQFERQSRESPLGVSFMLPCLTLTLKRGVERCLETQYPGLLADEEIHQKFVERINVLFVRLFDPDGLYARFGILDGTGKGISLSRRLDVLHVGQGNTHAKRLKSRAHRATPLVQSVLGDLGMNSAGDKQNDSRICDARTRKILCTGRLPGAVPARQMLVPPNDTEKQGTLLTLAMQRLVVGEAGRAARGPQSARAMAGKLLLTPR